MMSGNGSSAAGPVVEGSEATFLRDVIEGSTDVPVIVYFRADWCGPCKTFGPDLERSVRSAGGAVRLVKIDVDSSQRIAAQLGVQSIPAVFAFKDGRPVDGMVGARTASELKEFIARLAPDAGLQADDGALERADELLRNGAAVEAAQLYAQILGRSQDSAAAFAGLVRANLALGEIDRAEGLLGTAPEKMSNDKDIVSARAAVDLAKQAASAGPAAPLRRKLEADPDDHRSRYDLAAALHAAGMTEEAIDELLELFRRDREWDDDAARKLLLRIFDSLKPGDPVALKGRRRLSSLVYS